MANKEISSAIGNWNNSIPFPKDAYALHCISEDLGFANSGSVMITREWEIVSPETVAIGDKTYNVAGQKIKQYLVTKVKDGDNWDEKKSDASFSRLAEDYKTLGYTESSIDDENPKLIAKGRTVDAIVSAEEGTARRAPTPEQAAKGIKLGDPIKVNGKEVKSFNLKINQIVGLNSTVKVESGAF